MDNRYQEVPHEVALKIMQRLSALADDLVLNQRHLSEAVWQYDDHMQYIPESVGTTWIIDNADDFARNLDAEAFLREHFDAPHCLELILLYPEVLKLVAEAKREMFVHDAYVRCGARNEGWIRAAIEVGITKQTIATTIKDHLERVPAMDPDSGIHTAFHEFFEGSTGHVKVDKRLRAEELRYLPAAECAAAPDYRDLWEFEPNTAWEVLGEEDFLGIARLCAEKAPHLVLQNRWQLARKLSPEHVQEICVAAAERVPSGLHQRLEDLQLLPIDVRVRIAKRITVRPHGNDASITAKFLADLLLSMDLPQAIAFYEQIDCTLSAINAAVLYRATWKLRHEASKRRTADWLDGVLQDRLKADGYVIGTIEEGQHTDRHGRARRQWQVGYDGLTFVQDRHQHRYYPKKDDAVLFRPAAGARLTPKVIAVMFIPATNENEYA